MVHVRILNIYLVLKFCHRKGVKDAAQTDEFLRLRQRKRSLLHFTFVVLLCCVVVSPVSAKLLLLYYFALLFSPVQSCSVLSPPPKLEKQHHNTAKVK